MNPAFILLLILYCIGLWFALSICYKKFGRLLEDIIGNAIKEMSEEGEENE